MGGPLEKRMPRFPPLEKPTTRASSGSSLGRSRHTAGRGYIGETPEGVIDVLKHAWEHPIAVQSDYARSHSAEVAFAASMGWLSTIAPDGLSYTRHWHLTAEGLIMLGDLT